jgi:hypothetical protein
MTSIQRATSRTVAAVALLLLAAGPASAQVITTNGSFESGLTGWTVVNQLGSDGTFGLQTGTLSPASGTTVPAPPAGLSAAMSDSQGPGSHVLYQDVVVPGGPIASATLSFNVFVGNRATAFFIPAPASLDFSTPALNQQARVDLMLNTADPFSVAPGDILFNAYQTAITDALVSGYSNFSLDVTGLLSVQLGNTLRLRFAEVDNVFGFQFGIDNVSLSVVPVPEPTSLVLAGIAGAVGIARRYRRRLV